MARLMVHLRLLFVLLVLNFTGYQAAEAHDIPSTFESTRVQARGGTYVAMPENEKSARFNPATLANSPHSFQFRLLDLNASLSRNLINTVAEFAEDGVANDDDSGPFLKVLDKLENKFGKRHLGRLDLALLAMRFGPVEILPFFTSINYLEARQPSVPVLHLNTDNRAGVLIATGFTVTESFEFGLSLRPTHRWNIKGQMGITDILDLGDEAAFNDYAENSYGFGIALNLAGVWKPIPQLRLALIVENVGDMGYLGDEPNKPAALPQKISTGFWYRHEMDAGWNLDISGDWQDMVNRGGYNVLRQTHMGLELGRSIFTSDHDVGFLFGLGQGYPSWGVFIDSWLFRLELSQYTQELGELPGQRPDERLSLSLSTSMSF